MCYFHQAALAPWGNIRLRSDLVACCRISSPFPRRYSKRRETLRAADQMASRHTRSILHLCNECLPLLTHIKRSTLFRVTKSLKNSGRPMDRKPGNDLTPLSTMHSQPKIPRVNVGCSRRLNMNPNACFHPGFIFVFQQNVTLNRTGFGTRTFSLRFAGSDIATFKLFTEFLARNSYRPH